MIAKDIALEVTFCCIFFSYGLACSFVYFLCDKVEQKVKYKAVKYLLDIAYSVVCFVPFFYFYVNFLDGNITLYEVAFFAFGFFVFSKFIKPIINKVIVDSIKNRPKHLERISSKIKSIIKK